MIKYYLINPTRMTNDNFIGFHKDVIKNADGITYKEAVSLLAAYTASVQRFSDYVSSLTEAEAKHQASITNAERMAQFNGFRTYVRNLCSHPDADLRALGDGLWELLKDFGYKAAKNQVAVTSMIERTLDRIKLLTADEKAAAVYAGSEFEIRVNALAESQETFRVSRDNRWIERVNRLLTTNKDLREECMGHFHRLYNFAEYTASVRGDLVCSEFVSCVKAVIGASKGLCRARSSKKPDESSPETPVSKPEIGEKSA